MAADCYIHKIEISFAEFAYLPLIDLSTCITTYFPFFKAADFFCVWNVHHCIGHNVLWAAVMGNSFPDILIFKLYCVV